VAEAALYLASDRAHFVTGTQLVLDAGFRRGKSHVFTRSAASVPGTCPAVFSWPVLLAETQQGCRMMRPSISFGNLDVLQISRGETVMAVTEKDLDIMKIIVAKRAEDLKREGEGYLDAVNRITVELYEAIVEGKKNPISEIQSQGVDIGKIVSLVEALASVAGHIGKIIDKVLTGRAAKKKKMEELRTMAQPIVAGVYGT
jgi:hypothetical protein